MDTERLMAPTAAENQKAYRDRLKAKRHKSPDGMSEFLRVPFSEWFTDVDWSDVTFDFDLVGARADEEFPGKGDVDPFWQEAWGEGPNRGSLGVAERMVGVFLDAAVLMAEKINKYKLEQIAERISEIEAADLSDPHIKKQALADVAKLTKLRDELSKQVRWTLPAWKARGE
jgi:hypothetical protein